MKRYLFLTLLAFNINTIANSTTDVCQTLRNQLSSTLEDPQASRINSDVLSERTLKTCFNAKLLLTNAYDGQSKENYDIFINKLSDATMDIVQVMNVMDQVDENLRQTNGSLDESKSLVNTINLWQFVVFGKKLNAVVTGFGDDDYFVTTVFKNNDTKLLLMGAE